MEFDLRSLNQNQLQDELIESEAYRDRTIDRYDEGDKNPDTIESVLVYGRQYIAAKAELDRRVADEEITQERWLATMAAKHMGAVVVDRLSGHPGNILPFRRELPPKTIQTHVARRQMRRVPRSGTG